MTATTDDWNNWKLKISNQVKSISDRNIPGQLRLSIVSITEYTKCQKHDNELTLT